MSASVKKTKSINQSTIKSNKKMSANYSKHTQNIHMLNMF